MINALKLLANEQEDGDDFLQNIGNNLGKESRRGLTDGLRDFIKVDNERALDVGALRRGTGNTSSSEAENSGRGSDVWSGRARIIESLEGFDKCQPLEPERWNPPLVDADGYAFCQALYKGIEGEDREEMFESYKEMSGAVGVRKPQEAQKEEFYDAPREEDFKKK